MKLKRFLNKLLGRPEKPHPKLSLLIPFRSSDKQRDKVFKWLLKYWRAELPEAEIIIGRSRGNPFSKTRALNNAVKKSTGKVLVVLDADAYMPGYILDDCADKILEDPNDRLWFVPYRNLYRLNRRVTKEIISSDPSDPMRLPSPPDPQDIDPTGHHSGYGHRYGAMVTIFPREALDVLGCFDERFKGWGGEDIAFLRAMDTLYGKHKTTKNDVLHLWHPVIGKNYRTRLWKGQNKQMNSNLASRYHQATRKPEKMRALVDEGCKKPKKKKKINDKWNASQMAAD